MIEQFFANPNKPPPVTHTQTGHFTHTEYARASARKLTPMEYRRRVSVVSQAVNESKFFVGDYVMPTQAAALKQYGLCVVRAICRHFDDYGDVQWSETPFILQVSPVKDPQTTVDCNIYWCKREAPLTLEQDEC